MDELLLNPQTRTQIKHFIASPAHSLIITGPEGMGKDTISRIIAAKLLPVEDDKLNTATFLQIEANNNAISINEIRSIQSFMKLKTQGKNIIRRVVQVNNAEKLTLEAQNAFLKVLEEPPLDSLIILLTSNFSALLPTIRSRAQRVDIKPVPKDIIVDYFGKNGRKTTEIERAYHISDGRIGLMQSILAADSDNQLINSIDQAKKLITAGTYERLLQVNNLAKHKVEIQELLNAIESICYAAVKKTSGEDSIQLKRWHESLKAVLRSEEQLGLNANLKLLLTDLFIKL